VPRCRLYTAIPHANGGNNLFDPDTPNAINIKEVVVEQKIKGVYQVTQTGDVNVTRQGGLTLYDKQQTMTDAFYINHRVTLPDDYVIYVDLHAQKGTGMYEWYIDKAWLQEELVYEGTAAQEGYYSGGLKLEMVKEE